MINSRSMNVALDTFEELLTISEFEDDPVICPVLLYSPNAEKFEHFHIHITPVGALNLRDWLDVYLKDHYIQPKPV